MRLPIDLWRAYSELELTLKQTATFPSISIDGNGRCFLCKDSDGAPFFLVRTSRLIDRPTFKLKHIRIAFDTKYSVDTPQYSGDDIFVRITCEDTSENLRKIFVYSVSSVLGSGSDKSPFDLVNSLVELFRQKSPVSRSVIGLWGELLFILSVQDLDDAVLAWHSEPTQLRDFVFASRAVEVKTSSSSKRCHIFRLEQVSTAGTNDLLCSILVERSDHGESVFQLCQRIDALCSEDIRPKFWEKVLPQLESFDTSEQDISFSYMGALDSVRFYRLSELNRPILGHSGLGKIQGLKFELLIDSDLPSVGF